MPADLGDLCPRCQHLFKQNLIVKHYFSLWKKIIFMFWTPREEKEQMDRSVSLTHIIDFWPQCQSFCRWPVVFEISVSLCSLFDSCEGDWISLILLFCSISIAPLSLNCICITLLRITAIRNIIRITHVNQIHCPRSPNYSVSEKLTVSYILCRGGPLTLGLTLFECLSN